MQCQLIAGLDAGVAVFGTQDPGRFALVIHWPGEDACTEDWDSLARIAMRNGAPLVCGGQSAVQGQPPLPLRVAYPLLWQERVMGAVVVAVKTSLDRQMGVIRLLQWGQAWLGLVDARCEDVPDRAGPASLELLQATVARPDYQGAAMAALSGLARQLSCERVSLGWGRGDRVRLSLISDTATFNTRSTRVCALESAMLEAVRAGAPLVHRAQDTDIPGAKTQTEPHGHAPPGLCIVPVAMEAGVWAVLALERDTEQGFDALSVSRCTSTAALILPVLALKRDCERPCHRLALRRVGHRLERLLGAEHLVRRLAVIAICLLAIPLVAGRGLYRVTAPSILEGAVQRAVVAPFDSYLSEVHTRAGQRVGEGEVLAELDDHELRLEHRRSVSEKLQLTSQHRRAVANMDQAQARILEAQIAQADARLGLLEEQLSRTRLVAPIAGLVISGDWNRSLGVPVSRGEVLFELAPLDDYRVALSVRDADIADIEVGQRGQLTLSAFPSRTLPLRVDNIARLSEEGPEGPMFRVEARIEAPTSALRPGMEGLAKIEVAQRRRLWIWTHRLVDWLRIQWLAWGP